MAGAILSMVEPALVLRGGESVPADGGGGGTKEEQVATRIGQQRNRQRHNSGRPYEGSTRQAKAEGKDLRQGEDRDEPVARSSGRPIRSRKKSS